MLRPHADASQGARDPSTKALASLAAEHSDKVFPIALDSADIPLNKAAAELIEEKFGKLDVVIANAGICNLLSLTCTTS